VLKRDVKLQPTNQPCVRCVPLISQGAVLKEMKEENMFTLQSTIEMEAAIKMEVIDESRLVACESQCDMNLLACDFSLCVVQSMWAERQWQNFCSSLKPISVTPAPHSLTSHCSQFFHTRSPDFWPAPLPFRSNVSSRKLKKVDRFFVQCNV